MDLLIISIMKIKHIVNYHRSYRINIRIEIIASQMKICWGSQCLGKLTEFTDGIANKIWVYSEGKEGLICLTSLCK